MSIIQRRNKQGNMACMIIDDKADELGKAPFSLIHARHHHGLYCVVWIMAQQQVYSGGEGIPPQMARRHRPVMRLHFDFYLWS